MTNEKFTNIVVAIDGSDLSKKAADYAVSLAKEQNAKVSAVAVVKFHQTDAFRGSSSTLEKFVRKQADIAQNWLDAVRSEADKSNVRFESKVIKTRTNVPEEIIKYAKDRKSDLIVMGTRGRTGFKKVLLGSVASAVVTHAGCPVMVIR
ncbi:MAG TPA: universal stress protein [Candidatus Nitrosotalea sp.]|nr:universal stress protein [Candidatus Nitrosotalea sp.]